MSSITVNLVGILGYFTLPLPIQIKQGDDLTINVHVLDYTGIEGAVSLTGQAILTITNQYAGDIIVQKSFNCAGVNDVSFTFTALETAALFANTYLYDMTYLGADGSISHFIYTNRFVVNEA